VSTLHKLCEVGTKVSKERGAAALFELEEEKRRKSMAGTADDGTSTGLSSTRGKMPPPHVMVSYNWDHQDVILRVVTSLQSRGYLVWVDTEQMKGATVDTMALAVEGSAVVLIGVSRAYKESSNCRMEGQYALQKKKALVPLMLVEGYEADGWLGMLLGTSMWYAFHGATLSSESAFESRVGSLCRELGARGRADATVVAAAPTAPTNDAPRGHSMTGTEHAGSDATAEAAAEPEQESSGASVSALREELRGLRLKELRKRAREAGLTDDALDDAVDESSDPKAAVVALLLREAAV
jgi:hypothetical protein